MTFEDFEKLDFGADQVELLEGELIRLPPAGRKHTEAAMRLYHRLLESMSRLSSPSLGAVYHEMGYKLTERPRSWLQPDVSITHPGQGGDKYYEGAPLVAFEIVSPDDRASDLERKVQKYLATGSEEVWVIYPEARHARKYTRDGQSKYEEQAIRSGLLPGIEIPFNDFL
jgi:Uma2 family endonuclease